jgi:hypothetical protein
MGSFALRVFLSSMVCAGCGKVSGTTVDAAGPMDAGIDADLSGNATIVTQAVLFATTGNIGAIDIVSMLPNNTVLTTGQTDANGSATIKVYPGGSVTAIYKHTINMGADLITWVGVKPGDTLTFGNRNPTTIGQTGTAMGSQTYTWPTLAAANFFETWTECGLGFFTTTGTTSVSIAETSLCHQEPMAVLYSAYDANGELINVGTRTGVAFSSGATVPLSTWSPAATGMITITGLPPEVTSVNGSFRNVIDPRAGPLFDFTASGVYNGTPTGGAFTATFKVAQIGVRTVGTLTLARPGYRAMQLADAFSTSTLTQTVAAPALPPWGQSSTIASTALRRASWFYVPDAASSYDGELVHVAWLHNISGTGHPSQWDFILPPGQTTIDFPALPAPLADSLPASDDTLTSSNTRVFDIPSIPSYDMLRTLPAADLLCLECGVRANDFQRVVFSTM